MKNFLTAPASNAVAIFAVLLGLVLGVVAISNESDITGLALGGSATNFTVLQTGDGTVSAPSHSFTDDTDTGLYRIGTNNVGLSAGGVKVLEGQAWAKGRNARDLKLWRAV